MWRGHCPPGPRARWCPHVGGPPARLLVAGPERRGSRRGGPGTASAEPQPDWAAQCTLREGELRPEREGARRGWRCPSPVLRPSGAGGPVASGPLLEGPWESKAGSWLGRLASPLPGSPARRRASALPVGRPVTGAGGRLRVCSQGPHHGQTAAPGARHARPRPSPSPPASGETPRARPGPGQVGRGPGSPGSGGPGQGAALASSWELRVPHSPLSACSPRGLRRLVEEHQACCWGCRRGC